MGLVRQSRWLGIAWRDGGIVARKILLNLAGLMLPMWRNLDAFEQKSCGVLDMLLSRLLVISCQVFWKIEQKLSALYYRNIFLLYMCCTAVLK